MKKPKLGIMPGDIIPTTAQSFLDFTKPGPAPVGIPERVVKTQSKKPLPYPGPKPGGLYLSGRPVPELGINPKPIKAPISGPAPRVRK